MNFENEVWKQITKEWWYHQPWLLDIQIPNYDNTKKIIPIIPNEVFYKDIKYSSMYVPFIYKHYKIKIYN